MPIATPSRNVSFLGGSTAAWFLHQLENANERKKAIMNNFGELSTLANCLGSFSAK